MRQVVRAVPVPEHARTYAVRLVIGTQPGGQYAPKIVNDYVALGSSPRGAQGLMLAAKVRALLDGRFAVSADDLRAVALPVLRHRLVVNFQGQAEGITTDRVLGELLDSLQPQGLG